MRFFCSFVPSQTLRISTYGFKVLLILMLALANGFHLYREICQQSGRVFTYLSSNIRTHARSEFLCNPILLQSSLHLGNVAPTLNVVIQSFLAFAESESILNMSGGSFIPSVKVKERERTC